MKLGDSLDMRCANLGAAHEAYVRNKQEGNIKDKSDHGFSQSELQEMIARAKQHGRKTDKE